MYSTGGCVAIEMAVDAAPGDCGRDEQVTPPARVQELATSMLDALWECIEQPAQAEGLLKTLR
jgi:hypothetical protein